MTNEKEIRKCMNYFPNAAKLILEDGRCISNHNPIITSLNCMLSLTQIRTLVIYWQDLSLIKLFILLPSVPNIHILTFSYLRLYKNDTISIKQNELFQSVSNTNYITNLTSVDNMFSKTKQEEIESILQLLLNGHLISLCFECESNGCLEYFQRLINAEDEVSHE
ncbi:hypothetical protein I4U23_016024 [Adineta vaga]|nr:hypothetical protein I4U23_016024 [Adineta vaga]